MVVWENSPRSQVNIVLKTPTVMMFGGVVFKVAWTLSEIRNHLSTWEDWIQHDGGAVVSYKWFLSESFVEQYFSMSYTKQKDMVKLFQLENALKCPLRCALGRPSPLFSINMSQLSVRWSPTANSWSYFYFLPLPLKHTPPLGVDVGIFVPPICWDRATSYKALPHVWKVSFKWTPDELAFRFCRCMFCVWEYNKSIGGVRPGSNEMLPFSVQ